MRFASAFLVLLLAPSTTDAPRHEIGNLVVDGVPEIPRRIVDRLNQYLNTRGATLLDWEPDGSGILISTRFGDTPQIHRVAAPGADRQQLTFFREPVFFARFDPKSKSGGFVFQMDTGGGEFYQYYWLDRQTGKHTLLTDGKSRNQGLLVAHGGGKLAFASTARNRTDFDLYVMTGTAPGGAKLVKEVRGDWNPIDWSPDDSKLLVRHEISINESYLHLLDPQSGELKDVNPLPGKKVSYDGSAVFARSGDALYYSSDEDSEFLRLTRYDLKTGKKQVLTPKINWDVLNLAVSLDGKWLAFTANEGGTSALYLAETAHPQQARRVELPKGVAFGLRFDRQSHRLGFTLNGPQSPSDVYSIDVRTRKLSRWTTSEIGGLNPDSFVSPDLIQYKTFDGRMIPAWYYHPRSAGAKPAPVVVLIHGGPEGQAEATFSSQVQYLVVELGVAVLEPNVRGSSGYGKSYLLLDNGFAREDTIKDIGSLLDWVATRPELDKGRVAVLGGSYGGFMVLSSMFHFNDRLRCGIDVVGISNFVSFLEHTESYRRDLRRVEYGDERDPKMRAFLQSISPTTNAAKIKRPLLVAQGKNDPRVPASEAEQIVKSVRGAGGRVWYVLATDEGHGYRKKANSDYLLAASMLFLEQNLLP